MLANLYDDTRVTRKELYVYGIRDPSYNSSRQVQQKYYLNVTRYQAQLY